MHIKTHLSVIVLLFSFFLFPAVSFATDEWEDVTPPSASNIRTVASFDDYVLVGTASGIFKSTDAGENWTAMNTGLTNQNVSSIAIAWIYDGDLGVYTADSDTVIYAGTAGGIFKSTLGGTTWTAVNTGLTDTDVNDIEIDQFLATQGTVTNIYAATASGVFVSEDAGDTWSAITTGLTEEVLNLESDFGNGYIFAATASGVFYSEMTSLSGSPESWTQSFDEDGIAVKDVNLLNPIGQINWVATDGGIYKSDESGASWVTKNEGLPSTNVLSVVSDYTDSNIAFAVVSGAGIYMTTGEAITSPQWLSINNTLSDLDTISLVTNPANSAIVYTVTADDVYKIEFSDLYIDITPPSTISDLTAAATSTYIRLEWTAPGDDSAYGTSTSYSIRYSSSTITSGNWSAATVLSGGPTPDAAGSSEFFEVDVDSSDGPFYFAITATDNNSNVSALSNIAEYDGRDLTAPSAPSGLSGSADSTSQITISWTASTDDVSLGGYVVYRDGDDIATTSSTSYADTGLSASTEYTYTVKAYDSSFNYSSASSDASVTTSAASSGGGGGGGGGGSSSGGGGSRRTTTTNIAEPTVTPSLVFAPTVTDSTASVAAVFPDFTKNLSAGTSGIEVILLQAVLFSEKVLTTFPSGRYDLNTINAVKAFQKMHGVASEGVPGYGVFGPKTRATLNALLRSRLGGGGGRSTQIAQASTTPAVMPQTSGFSFTRSLRIGMTGEDVRNLQIFFNTHGFTVSAAGAGSLGNETSYFGPATRKAAIAFQEYYRSEILTPLGLPSGTGIVGASTLRKIHSM